MKQFLLSIFVTFVLFVTTAIAYQKDVYVRSYIRSNGTVVKQHYRSFPDNNFSNNWSTKGNINPYTGSPGTKVTPPKPDNFYQMRPMITPHPMRYYFK